MIEITFDQPGKPIPAVRPDGKWSGEWASQSPLNQWRHATEGGGAEGNAMYCALTGNDSDEFYIESTPHWWSPPTRFDLRGTTTSFYLKAIEPIRTAEGYQPHLFVVNDYQSGDVGGWYLKQPVTIGDGQWFHNVIELVSDENLWLRYTGDLSLDETLRRAAFIGIMYYNGDRKFTGVRATGVLGIDRFRYGL
jgi:hypothetical protein